MGLVPQVSSLFFACCVNWLCALSNKSASASGKHFCLQVLYCSFMQAGCPSPSGRGRVGSRCCLLHPDHFNFTLAFSWLQAPSTAPSHPTPKASHSLPDYHLIIYSWSLDPQWRTKLCHFCPGTPVSYQQYLDLVRQNSDFKCNEFSFLLIIFCCCLYFLVFPVVVFRSYPLLVHIQLSQNFLNNLFVTLAFFFTCSSKLDGKISL